MSSVVMGIIGVVLFITLALATTVFLGPKVTERRLTAEAVSYLNQSSQIAQALEDYARDKGGYPSGSGVIPINALVSGGYMSSVPPGGAGSWQMNSTAKAILTPIAGAPSKALKICVVAREKAMMSSPSNVLKCDGSTGTLSLQDPCCLM